MDYIKRKPNVSVVIKRPDYSKSECTEYEIVKFVSYEVSQKDKDKAKSKAKGAANYNALSDAMISYSYTESLYNVDSPFSMTLTPEEDSAGLTWIDKIALMDLVFIEEFGVVRYVGLVHQARYSARMGQDGPSRTIMISGSGFGSLLKSFGLVMDPRLWLGKIADLENLHLKAELLADSSVKDLMDKFYDNFMTIVFSKPDGAFTQAVMKTLIEKYINKDEIAKDYKTLRPLVAGLYQTGVNNIWDMWGKVMPAPYCELFGRWDSTDGTDGTDGKYKIFARRAPFEAADWAGLKPDKVDIPAIVLTDYDIGYDDSEVFTAFFATASTMGITETMSMVLDGFKIDVPVDEGKWTKYGYRPLMTDIKFMKRDGEKGDGIPGALKEISGRMKEWYSKNDEFLSGTISLVSIDDKDVMKYPVVGSKVGFLGGEFYVEQIERKWSYGDSPRTSLKVTRGYLYTSSGEPSKAIDNLGKRLKEMENNSGA